MAITKRRFSLPDQQGFCPPLWAIQATHHLPGRSHSTFTGVRCVFCQPALLATPDRQISLTDPDARSMATSGRGSGVVGYNVQIAVDTEHHLIITHEVTNVPEVVVNRAGNVRPSASPSFSWKQDNHRYPSFAGRTALRHWPWCDIFKNHPRTSEMEEEVRSIAIALSNLEKEMKMIQQARE
jgi:hypothetical protein